MEKLLTVMSNDDFNCLLKEQTLLESEFNTHVTHNLKNDIVEYFKDLIGIDEVNCIMCLYKVNGNKVSIQKNYSDLNDYLEVASNCVILQFAANKALMLTMSFTDFININSDYDGDLRAHIGTDDSDLIAFVPYIKLKDCKYFISLDENWNAVDIDVDEAKVKDVRRMKIC